MTPTAREPRPCESATREQSPVALLAEFAARLTPLATEAVPIAHCGDRVLAEPLCADRDSPAADVSAMDGYAVCSSDFVGGRGRTLPLVAEARIGCPPPAGRFGGAVSIATGAPVPPGADAVIPREEVAEHLHEIAVPAGLSVRPGQHVRRTGENTRAGEVVLPAGVPITPAVTAALAAFGAVTPRIHRRVRVGLLVTGDELLGTTAPAGAAPWQLRDMNGPGLCTLLNPAGWVEIVELTHARDEFVPLAQTLTLLLERCDAVFLTGGVSKGDRDHVPAAVQHAGAEIVFHRLPIRPGKPLLGAIGPRGQAILGLPGNPVSVLVTARRFGVTALRRLAGFAMFNPPVPVIALPECAAGSADQPPLNLWWYRTVRLTTAGRAELVPTQGSGDIVSAARGDGFIEIPPLGTGAGPWPYYSWKL